MANITMVKYTAEQIDQVLALLTTIASDTKAYECSLPMMSAILDINNFLRGNAVVYEEEIPNTEADIPVEETAEAEKSEEEIILSGGGAE